MKTKLLSLLVCAAGAIAAQAAVGDVVTSLDDINSNTVYTLKVERGYMPNGDGTTQMIGTSNAANAGKFLIIKVDEFSFTNSNGVPIVSNYVIYSVDNGKFLANRSQNTNVYDLTPVQALFNISAGNQENTFIIKSALTDNWLQLGGSSQFELSDAAWKTQDRGNRWVLTVAEAESDVVTEAVTAAQSSLSEFLGSYMEQIGSIDATANANAKYIVKNVNRAFLNTTATVANASRHNYVEVAILKGAKGYYLYDVEHNKFIGTENLTSTDYPVAHYSLEMHENNTVDKYFFKLTSSSTNRMLQSDTGPTLTVTSTWSASDNGNKWAFFLVGHFDHTAAMEKIAQMEADLEVSAPITELGSLSTTEKYLLKNRYYDGYLKGNANGQRVLYVASGRANLKDPAFHWEIVNVPDLGYVFHNVGTGTYLTNYSTAPSAGEWEMTNNPVFVYNTLTDFTDAATGAKYFAIQNVDMVGRQTYLHVNSSGYTVNWGANEQSQFSISACGTVDDYAATVQQALLTAATNKITSLTSVDLDPESANGRIGYLTAEGNTNVAAAYESANAVNATEGATIHNKIVAIRNVVNTVKNGTTNVAVGKYYTIRGAHTDHASKYLTESYELTEALSGTTYNKLVAATLAANTVPAYWRFNKAQGDGNDAKYNIVAANSGNVMRAVGWSTTCLLIPANHSEAGMYTYLNKTNRQFDGVTLTSPKTAATMSITNGNGCSDTNVRSHNGKIVSGVIVTGNNWVIELVESVPVTFNENGYAAVQYPFAVQLPDGVSAYDLSTITNATQAVTMARTSNVVPANTPVLLKGATSADLTITYTAAANEVPATLQGTLMPATVENAFVLSGDQLVPANGGTVPANSAYYVSTEGDTTPKALAGDITTAINELTVDANAAAGAVYDLQGRRVSKATKGLYIINGKKVLVK